ncbi:putative quinol monooxygenase [Bacteroides sp. 224]|uniref:putative quinol monooxygenase n=1 Tax=Bacteroides sp. 224 TaxID=2302936 RepID=UPI0013D0FC22|nr:putative quinol monooxygenase [Bacteroides sp. 224]NDV65539.1 antibiotic biosynthesis monooxygenase [Bacteroides sp. 224]
MEKKTIVAWAEVTPGKEKEFITLAETLIEATRKEEGNISYNLYQSPFTPTSFMFYEEYKDQDAINTHATSAHFKTFAGGVETLLASKLIIKTL